uniref:Sugar phosphate transporter domain-containing protein n=1 Tax=Oryza meridionalis TaxID=40149 RepID=A0A0E0E2C3_9ORYZ
MMMSSGFQLGVIGSLALSVASSVAIVICNKALISTLGFPFATTLTSWHLMMTFCTLHVAQRLHFFEPKAIDGQTVILFGLLNGTSIGLLNLSLGFNSIGFYQGFIMLSCLIAVSVNFSTFLVIGTTSPVTYQVLGHLKTCLVLSFGYILLHDPFNARNILGILIAIFGMGLYSYFSVKEGKKKATNDPLPVSQMPEKETEPLLATKDNSDTKKANGVSHDC